MEFLYSRECCKSQVVRIYLEEKGIPYSILHVDTTAAREPAARVCGSEPVGGDSRAGGRG